MLFNFDRFSIFEYFRIEYSNECDNAKHTLQKVGYRIFPATKLHIVSEAGANLILVKAPSLCYLIQFEQPMFRHPVEDSAGR